MTELTKHSSKINATEVAESLTGFDEIGIKQAFGVTADELQGSMPARALLFTVNRRADPTLQARAAYEAVMNMPAKQLDDLFEDETPTEDSEQVSASGEGAGPLV